MRYPTERLGDHIQVLSGFAFKSKDFSDEGIPVIKIKNITPPSISLIDLSYVPEEIADKNEKFILQYDDVLIALTGSHINQMASVVGRVAKVRYNEKTVLNQRVGKITVNDADDCDLDFVYYYLSQDQVKIELASKAGGAANQANISPTDIKNLLIPFPEIAVQRKISSMLRTYDDLIENNQKQIKLLEEAAQRLYKEWFVDLRFPGYETAPITDGIPEGWAEGTLADLAVFKRGKTITKGRVNEGTVPVVAGGLEPAYYHDTPNTDAPVITVSGSGANAGFTRMYYTKVWASDCSYIDVSVTQDIAWVFCFLKENKTSIDSMQKGAAQPHVYAKDINAMKAVIPCDSLMEKFRTAAEPMFSKIGKLEMQIIMLAEARDRLLPKLMNREIEVYYNGA